MQNWPAAIRRMVLLIGFLAISSYIDFEILDLDGSDLGTSSSPCWCAVETATVEPESVFDLGKPLQTKSASDALLTSTSIRATSARDPSQLIVYTPVRARSALARRPLSSLTTPDDASAPDPA